MPLHLVGETIDETRTHYLSETGKLVQLMRGIYVDAGDEIDQVVLRHAVRIARYSIPGPTCLPPVLSCSALPPMDGST